MRLTRQTRHSPQQTLNLPAMVDVVMLLLIFFMATSTFSPPEQHIETQLSSSAPSPEVQFDDFEPVEIEIRNQDGSLIYYCDGQPYSEPEQLKNHLIRERAIADVEVVIRADDTVIFDRIIAIVDLCSNLNFSTIGFAVEE